MQSQTQSNGTKNVFKPVIHAQNLEFSYIPEQDSHISWHNSHITTTYSLYWPSVHQLQSLLSSTAWTSQRKMGQDNEAIFLKILVPFDCHQNRVKNIHFSFLISFLSCKKTQTSDIPMSLLIPWTVIHFKYLKYSLELGTLYNLKTSANKSERRVTQVLAAQFRPSSTIASYRNLI